MSPVPAGVCFLLHAVAKLGPLGGQATGDEKLVLRDLTCGGPDGCPGTSPSSGRAGRNELAWLAARGAGRGVEHKPVAASPRGLQRPWRARVLAHHWLAVGKGLGDRAIGAKISHLDHLLPFPDSAIVLKGFSAAQLAPSPTCAFN